MSDERSISEKVREAAQTLRVANIRAGYHRGGPMCPTEMERFADIWEDEDRAKAAQDALVDQLAQALFGLSGVKGWDCLSNYSRDHWRRQARELFNHFEIKMIQDVPF